MIYTKGRLVEIGTKVFGKFDYVKLHQPPELVKIIGYEIWLHDLLNQGTVNEDECTFVRQVGACFQKIGYLKDGDEMDELLLKAHGY